MTAPRIDYVCRHCGSTELRFDGVAEWNPDAQKMELIDTFDSPPMCNDCGNEGWAKTVDLPTKTESQS